jgi:aminobenzoyl-glutamate utilization protein B
MKACGLAVVVMLALIVPARLTLFAQGMDQNAVLASIDQKAQAYAKVAMQIWSFAEVGYQETKSSALLQEQLKSAGFTVAAGVADGDVGQRQAGHRHRWRI